MSVQSKTALNTTIDTDITTNGSNDITGAQLNSILGNIVDSYEDFVGSYTTVQIAALTGMTLRQRVFNTTDNDYEYYDGTRWVKEAHPKYKVYSALMNQTSTNAPVPTISDNNLGTIVWTYNSDGAYIGTLTGAFLAGKTHLKISNNNNNGAGGTGNMIDYTFYRLSDNQIGITTTDIDVVGGSITPINARLTNTPVEICVYY